jgi:hypothetical protein
MNHVTNIVYRSKRYEAILREHFSAVGNGLKELTFSARSKLPRTLKENLHWLGYQRNQIIHNPLVNTLKNEEHFINLINEIEASFYALIPSFQIERISAKDLTPPVHEKPIYIQQPSIKERVEIYQIPKSILIGAALISMGLLLGTLGSGFTEAQIRTEPIHRTFWFNGEHQIPIALWKYPLFMVFGGAISCVFGVVKFIHEKTQGGS